MDRRVYFWHLKALGYCNRQMRVWCKSHGISWRGLINDGIDADHLLSIDDSAMAQAAVAFAEASDWSATPMPGGTVIAKKCL
ncbi:hypothetical protein [Desulfobulbus oligotrophicus]|uniref:Uncharacterized protein n=1 Tax=Desulfobulbus oligotrophicus TaxID=1909699 RepID=A0A7T5VEC1_9BACT|nr:hypothetical protein [Desulfobulbus oligotrophicus]QQG66370.1 hypothetical protein HP555_11065 [Desulfobulbus oligotrophicus]